jgi:hypothetical protein
MNCTAAEQRDINRNIFFNRSCGGGYNPLNFLTDIKEFKAHDNFSLKCHKKKVPKLTPFRLEKPI